MADHDFDALADIQAVIERAGGDVKDFETEEVQNGGLAAMMSGVLGGEAPTHQHYILEVCVTGPTTRDIPDPDSAIQPDDVMTAIAIAHSWAKDQEMDELVEDLDDVGQRVGRQAAGDGHPVDEMSDFDVPMDGGDHA